MTREDLFGQALEIKEHPSRVLTTERKGSILVAYGDSVVWSLAADECRTWFVSQPKDIFYPFLIASTLTFINLYKSLRAFMKFYNPLLNFSYTLHD